MRQDGVQAQSAQGNTATGTPAERSNVTFHIDRLVLDGMPLSNGQISQLRATLQRELQHLITQSGLSAELSGQALPHLRAPVVQVSAPFCPADLGRQIARSVHASLNQSL